MLPDPVPVENKKSVDERKDQACFVARKQICWANCEGTVSMPVDGCM